MESKTATWQDIRDYLNYILGMIDGFSAASEKNDKVTIDAQTLYDSLGEQALDLLARLPKVTENEFSATPNYLSYEYAWPTEVTCDSLKTTTGSATNTTDKR